MIVDIIIISILALSIFLGYKKGLIELGIKLVACIIAIVITIMLYKPISNFIINNTKLDENIEEMIINNKTEIEEKEETIKDKILPEVANEISQNIIRVGTIIVLYLGIKIGLKFVTIIANLIAKLPILKQFNKIGGILFGALRGLAIIYLSLIIIKFIGEINPENNIHKEVEKSMIGKEMYNRNIIEIFLK